MSGKSHVIGMGVALGVLWSLVAPALAELPDTSAILSSYVRSFNATDEELYTNAVSNVAAEEFLLRNVPRFACPDRDLERTYYFRWWTYRKHLRRDLGIWTVSEFVPNVYWAGSGNTIVCPVGHHLHEGRWLRDPVYMRDLARFWLEDKRSEHRWQYSSWLYSSVCAAAEVNGDEALADGLLDAAVRFFERWETGFKRSAWPGQPPLQMGGDGKGSFLAVDNYEGTELSLGGCGYSPMFNSIMWAEADAISRRAARCGRHELAKRYADKASVIAEGLRARCWNRDLAFFTVGKEDGSFGTVRELHGYAPWYFGVPTGDCMPDWGRLIATNGFAGVAGLCYPERQAKGFAISYSGHECQWNGPSWPFATSVALTALMNDLHKHPDETRRTMFMSLMAQYAQQQQLRRPADGKVVPWIDEDHHPDRDEWIARKILLDRKQGPHERGKDYNHSTFCDLVISGVVGFIPDGKDGFVVDPLFPAGWEYLVLEDLRYRGHDVTVRWQKSCGLSVWVDGAEKASAAGLQRMPVSLGH